MGNPKPYTWDQTFEEAHVEIPIEAAVKAKDVVFTLAPNSLKVRHACVHHASTMPPPPLQRSWRADQMGGADERS
jgi:hypothetical protein